MRRERAVSPQTRTARWRSPSLLAGISILSLACPQPSSRPDPAPAAGPRDQVTIALVGTSDLHGYVEPRALKVKDRAGVEQTVHRGGLPLFGGYLANLRKHYPVLLLDGGDLFQGTMVSNLGEGQVVVDAYNALGYTAVAVGNHEFDYGPAGALAVPKAATDDPTGALKERMRAAKFPFLSANLLDKATGKPAVWDNLYTSKRVEIEGVPIGLIGAVTEDTPRTTNILNLRDVTIGPVVASVKAEAEALRKTGVAAVILTIHEGANCSAFDNPRNLGPCDNGDGRVLKVVRELSGAVDAVVAGHSHAGMAHFIDSVPVIQSFAYGVAFSRADLPFRKSGAGWVLDKAAIRVHPPTELCSVAVPPRAAPAAPPPAADSTPGGGDATRAKPGTVFRCDVGMLSGQDLTPARYEDSEVVPSAAVLAALQPHIDRAAAKRQSSLGVTLATKLRRAFRTESPLGALLADLLRSGATRIIGQNVDVAFQNGGGIRNELPAGPLTYGHLFEVLPFDNRLAVVTLTGAHLAELMRRNLQSSHGALIPSGMSVEARCAGSELQVTLRDERGNVFDAAKRYTVAVSDFLASGGDSFGAVVSTLPEGSVRYFDDVNLRELTAEELTRYRGPLINGQDPAPRLRLPSQRPVSCPPTATK